LLQVLLGACTFLDGCLELGEEFADVISVSNAEGAANIAALRNLNHARLALVQTLGGESGTLLAVEVEFPPGEDQGSLLDVVRSRLLKPLMTRKEGRTDDYALACPEVDGLRLAKLRLPQEVFREKRELGGIELAPNLVGDVIRRRVARP